MKRSLLTLLLLAVFIQAAAQTTEPPFVSVNLSGAIVYAIHGEYSYLVTRNFDSEEEISTQDLALSGAFADLSPDLTRVTYSAIAGSGNSAIYVADIDGQNAQKISTNDAVNDGAVWSPDGGRIIYIARTYEPRHTYFEVYEVASGTTTAFDVGKSGIDGIDWSPDGRKVVYRAYSRYGVGLYIYDFDTQTETKLFPFQAAAPNWSPDGLQLAFWKSEDLFIINADGTGLHRVFDPFGDLWDYHWISDDFIYVTPQNLIVSVNDDAQFSTDLSLEWYVPDSGMTHPNLRRLHIEIIGAPE